MATAEQIKALIRSHFGDEQERFFSIVLQIAAHEAMQGHASLAQELKDLVSTERRKRPNRVISFPPDLSGLVMTEEPSERMGMLVIPQALKQRLKRILLEFHQRSLIKRHGLEHRRKILLMGASGTGKTMTARVISGELGLRLNTIQVHRLVTKFMGETSSKLRQIFDLIETETAVYLFDEFDAIGGERSLDNDVGEMRRVLNSFLQFIEQDESDSIIIAATNTPDLLDRALFRRFDDVLSYHKPSAAERLALFRNTLGIFVDSSLEETKIIAESEGLCQAEIVSACRDSMKNAILSDQDVVTTPDLIASIRERKNIN